MKFNACHIFSLVSFLLVTLVPLFSAALTTFGKTPNASGSSRPCNTDGDCYSIKYSSCARDPSTGRRLCLCADSRTPIGNSCDQIPTALHLPCEKDEQCIPNAGCMMNSTTGSRMCMCRDNSTEVGNICNDVPLWYSSWLQTILTVMKYAPPKSGTPYFPDAPHFPLAPPHAGNPLETNEIVIIPKQTLKPYPQEVKTLDETTPNWTKRGSRYFVINQMHETNQITKDSNKMTKDSNQMTKDSNQMTKDSNQMTKDSIQMTKDSNQMMNDSNQMAKVPNQMTKDSSQMTKDSNQMTKDSNQMRNDSNQMAKVPNQMTKDSNPMTKSWNQKTRDSLLKKKLMGQLAW